MSSDADLTRLQSQWTELYSKTLPSLARARDPAQPTWPVTLDHCFARIILDNTVGGGEKQWDKVIGRPAVRNMDASQIREAIELGTKIAQGEADLVQLDLSSLRARGKGEKKYNSSQVTETSRKRPRNVSTETDTNGQSPEKKRKQSTLSFPNVSASVSESSSTAKKKKAEAGQERPSASDPLISSLLHKIAHNTSLTDYRKHLYSTLLSVPAGCYTTYAALSNTLNSSARAVGSGMRNNPYAPDVPCHRVLAADGSIGGFHGHWGKDGKYANNKIELLKGEGVTFDSRGKVKGPVFIDLKDLSQDLPSSGK